MPNIFCQFVLMSAFRATASALPLYTLPKLYLFAPFSRVSIPPLSPVSTTSTTHVLGTVV